MPKRKPKSKARRPFIAARRERQTVLLDYAKYVFKAKSEGASIMNLKEWREQRTYELDLPSGLAVRCKKPQLIDLLLGMDHLPDSLSGLIQEMIKAISKKGVDRQEIAKNALSHLTDETGVRDLVNVTCRAAIINPPLLPDPVPANMKTTDREDYLDLDELPFGDRMFIFNWANGGDKVIKFRQEPAATVESAPVGENLLAEAIDVPGALA